MSVPRLAWLCFVGVSALVACAQSGPAVDRHATRFLQRCSGYDDCDDGLGCICGACSTGCTSADFCDSFDPGARCVEPRDQKCIYGPTCDVQCRARVDCASLGTEYECSQGRCRAAAGATSSRPPSVPDPALTYGPCQNNPMCGDGSRLVEHSATGQCICVVDCGADDQCPAPKTGSSTPTCVLSNDATLAARSVGHCELACDADRRCPDGAVCTAGVCRFSSIARRCADSICYRVDSPPNRRSCQLASVVGLLSGEAPLIECGTLPVFAGAAERAAAIECVHDAIRDGTPFNFAWAMQGTDSQVAEGFAGTREQGVLVVRHLLFDSFGIGPSGFTSYWSRCKALSVQENCGAVESDLDGRGTLSCFQCEVSTDPECRCTPAVAVADPPAVECGALPVDP